jgi:hypothetical protein
VILTTAYNSFFRGDKMRQGRQERRHDLCAIFEATERGIMEEDGYGLINTREDARQDGAAILHAEDVEFESTEGHEGFGIEGCYAEQELAAA